MKQKKIIESFLLLSLLFLLTPSINSSVFAYEGGTAVFCPNTYIPYPEGPDTENELYVSYQTCYYISNFLSNYGNNDLNYYRHDEQVGEYTWGAYLYTLKSNTDYATIFSKGHNVQNWNPNHYMLLDNDAGDGATDSNHIWSYTSNNENYFVFIWHCGTAQSYPSSQDAYGWYGMPYAFTQNNNMNYYGTTGDYIYMGWDWYSPQFETEITWQNPDLNWTYAHYAYFFFDYMTNGNSVWTSLALVSDDIGSTTFGGSGLYGDLVCYGNVYSDLPD